LSATLEFGLDTFVPVTVDETGLLKGIAGAAQIWRALDACGVPEVLGVWNHEAGPATRFTVIQIRQRYPGHARQALHVAAACQGGAYAGKWTVVVDDATPSVTLTGTSWLGSTLRSLTSFSAKP